MTHNNYSNSFKKRLFDFVISLFCIFVTLPVVILISILIKTTSIGGVFFVQKRTGKHGKIFKIIKFRTMVKNASQIKPRLKKLNEADGPVFKIFDDPRFTKMGKILSRLGLDELPQFINVLRGDMSIVGPRPLPIAEARKLSKNQRIRERVKPGMTSDWVVKGAHRLSFKKWMQLDKEYVKNASFFGDLKIIWRTILMLFF